MEIPDDDARAVALTGVAATVAPNDLDQVNQIANAITDVRKKIEARFAIVEALVRLIP